MLEQFWNGRVERCVTQAGLSSVTAVVVDDESQSWDGALAFVPTLHQPAFREDDYAFDLLSPRDPPAPGDPICPVCPVRGPARPHSEQPKCTSLLLSGERLTVGSRDISTG